MITKKKLIIASTDFRTIKSRILVYYLNNNLPMPFSRLVISPRMRLTSFLKLPISLFSQITSSSSIRRQLERRCFLGRDGPGIPGCSSLLRFWLVCLDL